MRFGIEYVSRRRWCYGVDVEDQSWRKAAGEIVEGSVDDADAYARDLDAITDHEFVHRAVPLPIEPEDEPELAALAACAAPVSGVQRAS